MPFHEQTCRALDELAVTAQRDGRVPGLVAGVARAGVLQWSRGIGSRDLDLAPDDPAAVPDAGTQYPVASISKTFTAVLVMMLRDEGRLDLDDTVETHLPGSAQDGVTLRQLLAHTSGMQREPVNGPFEHMVMPEREEIVSGWDEAQRVGRPHDRWHYSNLGFAVLGEIVARLEGRPWPEVVRDRLTDPLEMRRTGTRPEGPRAKGYYVPPFTDVPLPEPDVDAKGLDPAGGLRSTATDLARWGGFLAEPDAAILSPDTLEEMCQPQVMADPRGWTLAWGLGLQLLRHQGRTWVGHTGGWPGSVTGCFTDRESATTAVLLMNASTPVAPATAAAGMGTLAIEREPVDPQPWTPGTTVPDELAPLLGHWYTEGSHLVMSVREGRLEARLAAAPSSAPPAVFEEVAPDRYRTVSGRERGEPLVVVRGPDGQVSHLLWATYRVTREPLTFDAPL